MNKCGQNERKKPILKMIFCSRGMEMKENNTWTRKDFGGNKEIEFMQKLIKMQ